ncbi:DUF1570 domain-containing protein [Planctomycetota bacterium]|nr:DUF1570 domain-containing protein [Planctomycetota bacterium]
MIIRRVLRFVVAASVTCLTLGLILGLTSQWIFAALNDPQSTTQASVHNSTQLVSDHVLKTQPGAKWYRTDHYLIHAKLPKKRVLPIGKHLDQMFEIYEARFQGLIGEEQGPMQVYLFDREHQYINFLAKHGVKANNSGGMFVYRENLKCLAVWIGDKPRREIFAVLQHEGFHQFVWNYIGKDLPVWMNEGLAQYFEDAVITGKKMNTGLTDVNRAKLVKRMIRERDYLSFPDIMNLDHDQWSNILGDDAERASKLYAQAWSMVYFLIHSNDGKYAAGVNSYLTKLNNGEDPGWAFKRIFGFDLRRMERDWTRFAFAMENDPVNEAVERMRYLSVALKHFKEQNIKVPRDMNKVRNLMQRYSIEVTWTVDGEAETITSDDSRLYSFNRRGRDTDFVLLESSRNDMPLRILAQGLSPEPTLIWRENNSGQLIADIEYR